MNNLQEEQLEKAIWNNIASMSLEDLRDFVFDEIWFHYITENPIKRDNYINDWKEEK